MTTEKINSNNSNSQMTGFFESEKNRVTAIVISLAIGILFTLMFIDRAIGLNYFIFCVAMTGAVGTVMYRDNNLDFKKFAFFATTFLMFASVFFRLGGIIYTVFTILFLPILFVLMSVFSSKNPPSSIFFSTLFRFFGSIAFVDKIFKAIKSLSDKNAGNKKTTVKIVVGIAIAVFLLSIIIPLMFAADSIFQEIIKKAIDFTNLRELLWKAVLSVVITILFFGFLYIITVKKDVPVVERKDVVLDFSTTLLTVLSILGVVYLTFAIVQFRYLFIDINGTLPEGFTYTAYARNGYFEQVALTVINAIIILTSIAFTKRTTGKKMKFMNLILTCFNMINLYLMISSAYKMYLYQNEYGFTTLRLLVYILLVYELIMIVVLQIKIFRRKIEFFKFALYISVGFWAIISFINVEGLSVDLNIRQFYKTKEIDISYITWQTDTSSQLKELYINYYDNLSNKDIQRTENFFGLEDSDGKTLTLAEYDEKMGQNKWLEFNFSKSNRYNMGREVLLYKLAKEQ